MTYGILETIKLMLGPDVSDETFDTDIIVHINTALSTLTQLGVGPADGYAIEGYSETWDDFIGSNNPKLQGVISYVYLRVRLLFDPPSSSSVAAGMEKTIDQLEWRLSVAKELD